MDKVNGFILPIGVALVVLMYTTFGVLTFSTARADYNLSKRNEQYNEDYYRVEGNFEKILFDSNKELQKIFEQNDYTSVKKYSDTISGIEVVSSSLERAEIVYAEKVSENVMFKGHYIIRKNKAVEIKNRGLLNVEEWEQQNLKVWEGSEEGAENGN